MADHPEVERTAIYGPVWPAHRPFPLTPLEAWYLVQGYAVRPAGPLTAQQVLRIPVPLAMTREGYLMLRRS